MVDQLEECGADETLWCFTICGDWSVGFAWCLSAVSLRHSLGMDCGFEMLWLEIPRFSFGNMPSTLELSALSPYDPANGNCLRLWAV